MYDDERGRRQGGGERVVDGVVADVGAVAVDDVVTDVADVAEAVVVLLAAEAVARE